MTEKEYNLGKPKIFQPYDYQEVGINAIRQAMAKGYRRVIYQLPTGGGKTAVFGFITKAVNARGKNTWVVAHRDNLVRQASASLSDLGVDHGIIARGSKAFQPYSTQVCSVQTLVRRFDKLPMEPYLIIIDEAHHCAGKNTWTKVIERYPNALVLGVTATPIRLDGKGLNTVFDVMINGPSMKELIKRKRITPLRCFEPEVIDTSELHKLGGDFKKNEVNDLMDKPKIIGNAVSHYRKICPTARALVFCPSISIATKVSEQFSAEGIPASVIHGKMTAEEQWAIIQALAEKRIMVLATVDVVSEGTDIPAVEAGIMMRPTASLVIYLQQAGRIMRMFEGKEYGFLLDMVGNIDRHGPVDMDREWSLEGEDKSKRPAKKKEPSLGLYRCANCFYKFPREQGVCPLCKTPVDSSGREIDHAEGELKEMDADRTRRLEEKRAKRREEGMAESLVDLYVLADKRGYKWGWAEKKFEGRNKCFLTADEKRKAMREAYRILGK